MCTKKRLTVLIPFLNEGEEVVTTVQEVRRTVGNEVDIVVVNDGSTDNWDYERLLQPYNVDYISNPQNLGSAPSRDICMSKCETPYFLFLDAHMRFYENNWHTKLINLLNQNSRRILCAQTICLEKNDQGTVTRTQEQQKTYGAYMPLLVGDNIPDIKWNNIEFNPNASMEAIPYVLGAAYAGSVEYWNYLKGMQGLKKYGCEEQYISIKAWLDGGGCYILKNFKVGHIYRKKSPYLHHTTQELYNYLFISSTLLPPTLKAKAFATMYSKYDTQYKNIITILHNESNTIEKLSKYYKKLNAFDFSYFLNLNKKIRYSLILKELNDYIPYLPIMAEHMVKHISPKICLSEGNIGQYLWLKIYHKLAGTYDEHYNHELGNVITHIITDGQHLPLSSYCELGWVLIILYEHEITQEIPFEALYFIDDYINHSDITDKRIVNVPQVFLILLAYINIRIKLSYTRNIHYRLNQDKIIQLKDTTNTLKIKYKQNLKLLNQIFVFEEYIRNNVDSEPTSFSDVLSFKIGFPQNSKYWGHNISAPNNSTTLLLMLTLLNLKQ